MKFILLLPLLVLRLAGAQAQSKPVPLEHFTVFREYLYVGRVYPLTQSFDLDGSENHVFEFGATGYFAAPRSVTVDNRHQGRYATHDFPDVRADLHERSSRQYFLSWKRKGRWMGNHLTFHFSGFDKETWGDQGEGVGFQIGINKTVGLGSLASTAFLAYEVTRESGYGPSTRYTDSLGTLIRWNEGGSALTKRHYKGGLTFLIRDLLGPWQPVWSLNMSIGQPYEDEEFPYSTLGNGLGLRHMGWKGLAPCLTYFNTWIFDPLFGTKALHRLEGKLGW